MNREINVSRDVESLLSCLAETLEAYPAITPIWRNDIEIIRRNPSSAEVFDAVDRLHLFAVDYLPESEDIVDILTVLRCRLIECF